MAETAHPVPISLSPSSMGTFTSCPLAFRFSYIERLPEPPSAPASKGTLVHLALQYLMWRPPAERTLEAGLKDLDRAVADVADDPEFSELELTEEERIAFHSDAEKLVRRYFEMEDPTTVRVLGVELRVSAKTADGVTIRGVIDRLELDEDGELVVTDYKTGSAPSEGWEQKSLAGVHVYSMLCERVFGRRPARIQLLYLSRPERIMFTPNDQSLRGVEVKTGAVMKAVRAACARDDFRPRASALCAFCSFREFCPEFGGRPAEARPTLLARQAERDGQPQLPLVFV
ncbi:MAG TPA: PD-(D/E)XK nuclease family protein [Acidimicrobiia bacterium]|nr:PD-(D/E)XK nuclease family protein [Acidimicrobiia bacterium]